MASHFEKNADETSPKTCIPPFGGSEKQEQHPTTYEWSEEFDCAIINGVLAPVPLSAVPMDTRFEELESGKAASRKRPRKSALTIAGTGEQQQPAASPAESSRRKRRTEGNEELFFKLYKFLKVGEQYLLETHTVNTGRIDLWHLQVYETNTGWKVRVYDLPQGDHVVFPMLEDPSPLVFHKKYEFSLQERLQGWTVEKRKRGNGKEDTGKQFRSFVEMAAFILYSSKLKDLKLVSTCANSQELLEADAAEAIMTISSYKACSNLGSSDHGPLEKNKSSSAGMASEKKTANLSWEENKSKSPIAENINDNKHAENSSLALEDPTGLQGPTEEKQNIFVLENPSEGEKTEADKIESEYMDFICDFFKDELRQE